MASKREVVITGMGVLSPIGVSLDELTSHLLSAKSGIHLWESHYLTKKFPAALLLQAFETEFTRLELPYLDRCAQMAILSARQAVSDAGLSSFAEYGARAGLYFGSARAGTSAEEKWFEELLLEHKQTARPFSVFAIMHNAPAAHVSIRHQILGPVMTHSSACTSSGCAIGDAARAIRDGYLDVAVAGGAEAPITASVLGAWDGTRALAAIDEGDVGQSCRPFATRRTGLVMGEGAAFVVLESREHAKKRGVKIHAVLSGYGIASDGYHIGSPKMEGQAQAMTAALEDAHCRPEQIDYFNAHATGTRGGDQVEAKAIRQAFGGATDNMPVSSTKSMHGHLLGAASVLELIITILGMQNSFAPATLGLDEVDPECNLRHVPNQPLLDHPIRHAMSFSSGLGGTNTALIVSKADTP
jgi:3-oxoacyl-(acyl-carrier-protein) synthase